MKIPVRNLTSAQLCENICSAIREFSGPGSEVTPLYRDTKIRKIRKWHKKGRLVPMLAHTANKDEGVELRQWLYRSCCDELAKGHYDWTGWEYRSDAAMNWAQREWIYPRWDGGRRKLLVIAEQGIGDEIVFASCFNELLDANGSANTTIECDPRLMPVFKRSIPHTTFISRFRSEKIEDHKVNTDYDPDEYEAFIPAGQVPKLFRRKAVDFPKRAFLYASMALREELILQAHTIELNHPNGLDGLRIGVSWQGRQGSIDPEVLRSLLERKFPRAVFYDLQYTKPGAAWLEDQTLDWMIKLEQPTYDHTFALTSIMDRVVTVPTAILHVAGALGVSCDVIRPPPMYSNRDGDNMIHNRLPWLFSKWRGSMAWYKAVNLYESVHDYAHR